MRALALAMVPGCPDVDDIIQETSVAMWKRFGEYDPERPFAAWALGFTRMQVMAYLERQSRRNRLFSAESLEKIANHFIQTAGQQEHPTAQEPRLVALEQCLSRLNERERNMLRLRYREGFGVTELADSGHFNKGREALYKAYARLQQRLLKCIRNRLKHFS